MLDDQVDHQEARKELIMPVRSQLDITRRMKREMGIRDGLGTMRGDEVDLRPMDDVVKSDFASKPWSQERPIRKPDRDRTVILETGPNEVPKIPLMIDNNSNVSGHRSVGLFDLGPRPNDCDEPRRANAGPRANGSIAC